MTTQIEYITPNAAECIEDIDHEKETGYSCFDEFDNYVEENCLLRAKIISEPVHKIIHYTDHSQLDLFDKPKQIKEETVSFTIKAPMRFQSERGRLIEVTNHDVVISNEEAALFSPQDALSNLVASKVFQKGSYVLLKGTYMFQHFNIKSSARNTQTMERSVFMISHEEDHIVPNHNPQRVPGWSEQHASQKMTRDESLEEGAQLRGSASRSSPSRSVFDDQDFSDYFSDRKVS